MKSELDQLLEEMDYCLADSKTKQGNKPQANSTAKQAKPDAGKNSYMDSLINSPPIKDPGSNKTKNKEDSLDDLLEEAAKITSEYKDTKPSPSWANKASPEKSPSIFSSKLVASETRSQKCFVPYIGPSSPDKPLLSSSNPCARLRCIKCDFVVHRFEGARWDDNCDYYFFRNYVGNVSELKKKLAKDSSSVAYACQCSWRTTNELEDVSKLKDLKWVCGGH